MTDTPLSQDLARAAFAGVEKRFGERLVFTGLSFELKRGGRYALLGPNGAGKSTLTRLLAGTLVPDRGTVRVGGLDPFARPAQVRAGLGFLPEGAPLVGDLTVREHLRLAGRLRNLSPQNIQREEERLVGALGLAPFYRRPAAALSQGQKRRAALASAFVGSPDFLVLDEPTSGLDPEEAGRLRALLAAWPDSITLLISSHILGEVLEMASAALILARGRLAAFGSWGDLLGGGVAAGPAELREAYRKFVGAEAGS